MGPSNAAGDTAAAGATAAARALRAPEPAPHGAHVSAIAAMVFLTGAVVTAYVVGDDPDSGSQDQTAQTAAGVSAGSPLDAVVPVPGERRRFWVFSGRGRLQEPRPLADWPSLRPFRTD